MQRLGDQHNTVLPRERGGDHSLLHPIGQDHECHFDDYGELSQDEHKSLISKLKERKFSYLVFSLRHPYGVQLRLP